MQNTLDYNLGYRNALRFFAVLRELRKITHEPTLIELYGKKIEKIGHIAQLSTVTENYLYGVICAIMHSNALSINGEHFALCFDSDSDWIQVSLSWQ